MQGTISSLVSANRVFKMSQNNKYFRESTLLGCALPTASNAILNVAKIKKNSRVLIMGMGGLGYSSLLVLNYIKCKDIVCIDNNLKRLNLTSKSVNTNFKEINDSNIEKFLKDIKKEEFSRGKFEEERGFINGRA